MTSGIQQMLAVVSERFGLVLDSRARSAARFIIHARSPFVRIQSRRQLGGQESTIGLGICENHPEATRTAEQLATIVQLRLGEVLSADAVSYPALHSARMTLDAGGHEADWGYPGASGASGQGGAASCRDVMGASASWAFLSASSPRRRFADRFLHNGVFSTGLSTAERVGVGEGGFFLWLVHIPDRCLVFWWVAG